MKRRITRKGFVGLMVGLAGTIYLLARPGASAAPSPQATPAAPSAPAEQIDVEQAVSFPYDI